MIKLIHPKAKIVWEYGGRGMSNKKTASVNIGVITLNNERKDFVVPEEYFGKIQEFINTLEL